MSHVAMQECKAGEPMFASLDALTMAVEMLGGKIEKKKDYHWYNRHVGDYPIPKGMKAQDLGHNAEYVISVRDDKLKELGIAGKPYDLGLVNDPNNPGCYTPLYDFYCGGMGLDKMIGSPLFGANQNQILTLCPKLKQMYDMCCDKLAAAEAGDQIDFLTLAAARAKYPDLFPGDGYADDTEQWVSVAEPNKSRVKVH